MKTTLVISFALSLGLAACSNNNSKEKGDPQNPAGKPGSPGDPSGTGQYKESYRLVFSSCDTGKHEFSASSLDEVKRLVCEALQDDELNKSCAEPLRRDRFDKLCTGMVWTPKYAPRPPTPPPSTSVVIAEKVRKSLQFILADKYEIAANLTEADQKSATLLAEDLVSCGISYLGPKCIGSLTSESVTSGLAGDPQGQMTYFSELKLSGDETLIGFKFTVEAAEPSPKITQLEVVQILKVRGQENFLTYLNDPQNFKNLISLSLIHFTKEEALKRLETPRDIRQIYHLSKELVTNPDQSFVATIATISNHFSANLEKILASKLLKYQDLCLDLALDYLQISDDKMKTLTEGLLASGSDWAKDVSAAHLLNQEPARAELKPKVLAALRNSRWQTRRDAIEGLVKSGNLSNEEKNKILEAMNDSVEPVREAAEIAGNSLDLDESNLEMLKSLSQSSIWTTRKGISSMLNRIPSLAASQILIGMMSDSVEPVREEVFSLLTNRNLNKEEIPLLATQSDSANWTTRLASVKLLSRINEDEATLVLINHMSDSVEPVRTEIVDRLSSRSLNAQFLQPLKTQLESTVWTVRRDAAKLISKIDDPEAVTLLIQHMSDSVEPVRSEISSRLEEKSLTKENVPTLAQQFQSSQWQVRLTVATLLGKIKDPKSLAALNAQKNVESVTPVKEEIDRSIEKVQ